MINNDTSRISNFKPKVKSDDQRSILYNKFQSRIIHNSCLDRTLVSFQANKQAAFSWLKYREGFSEKLVTYVIQELKLQLLLISRIIFEAIARPVLK